MEKMGTLLGMFNVLEKELMLSTVVLVLISCIENMVLLKNSDVIIGLKFICLNAEVVRIR